MQFLFVTPQSRANYDGGATLSGVTSIPGSILIDDVANKAQADFVAIEDLAAGNFGPGKAKRVQVALTGGTMTLAQLQTAFKTAVQALIPGAPLQ